MRLLPRNWPPGLLALLPLAASAQDVLPLSGLWYDPSIEGDGFNIIVAPTGTTVFFYGYDRDGRPLWLVSNTRLEALVAGESALFQMFAGDNGTFEIPGSPSSLLDWGTLSVRVIDCDNLDFELNGLDGIRQWRAVKLAGIAGADRSACEGLPVTEMSLTSPAFDRVTPIPVRHTCGGPDVAPPIQWAGVPPSTARLALVMDDTNPPCGTGVGACRHWQVYNIPPAVTGFGDGEDPTAIEGVVLGAAYNGQNRYAGPCPPIQHSYTFTLYALRDTMPVLQSGRNYSRASFEALFGEHVIASASLISFFP